MEKLKKKQPISSLKEGDNVLDIFVVKIKKPVTKYSRGFFFSLILSDSSGGSIEYKYWGGEQEEKVREIFNSISADSVVLIHGKVSSYNNRLDISADASQAIKVLTPDQYEAEFIPGERRDMDEMLKAFEEKLESIADDNIKKFMHSIFDDEIKKKFKEHPGAIQIHHAWKGGLIQHVLEVIEYCEVAVRVNPSLSRDLLIVGAALHDIGKLEDLEVTSRIKGSRKGQLIGHLALGLISLGEKLKEDTGLDGLTKEKILHLVVSHHGKKEYGSPLEPMLPEAVVLSFADDLSCKLTEIMEFIDENKEVTEDDFMFNYKHKKNILLR